MRKIVFGFLVLVLIVGCKKAENLNYKDIYILALESLMEEEPEMNGDIKYIAINSKTLVKVNDDEVSEIIKCFSRYDVEVIDESFESLNEKDMVFDGNYIEGVLLEVTKLEVISKQKVKVECSKFRSGKGAIGLEFNIVYEDGTWKVDEVKMQWIS